MKPQNELRWFSSPWLRMNGWNGASVRCRGALPAGPAWIFVPQALKPGAIAALFRVAAEPAQLEPVCSVGITFTTMLVGTAGVRVFEIRSLITESETSAFGVTAQEQHEISCSS